MAGRTIKKAESSLGWWAAFVAAMFTLLVNAAVGYIQWLPNDFYATLLNSAKTTGKAGSATDVLWAEIFDIFGGFELTFAGLLFFYALGQFLSRAIVLGNLRSESFPRID